MPVQYATPRDLVEACISATKRAPAVVAVGAGTNRAPAGRNPCAATVKRTAGNGCSLMRCTVLRRSCAPSLARLCPIDLERLSSRRAPACGQAIGAALWRTGRRTSRTVAAAGVAAVSLRNDVAALRRVGDHWYGGDWFAGRHAPTVRCGSLSPTSPATATTPICSPAACRASGKRVGRTARSMTASPPTCSPRCTTCCGTACPTASTSNARWFAWLADGEATIAPAGGTRVLLRRAAPQTGSAEIARHLARSQSSAWQRPADLAARRWR